MMEILYAVLIIGTIGIVFGVVLSLANKFLHVPEDHRIDEVEKLLPGLNCGACGTPSCKAFATEIVGGKAGNLSRCKPGKRDTNYIPIIEFLKQNPNPDGSQVPIKL